MDYFEFVIVGSGPSGVAAARELINNDTCLIDVSEKTDSDFYHPTLQAAKETADLKSLLGEHWEMLANLVKPGQAHQKLRANGLNNVLSGKRYYVHDKTGGCVLKSAGSYAKGGMSTVWGAQLLRFTEDDMIGLDDWPIDVRSLNDIYGDLERHIGIAGEIDDMDQFLGRTENLLPPVSTVPSATSLLQRYSHIKKSSGFLLGRSRLAVLTKAYRGYGEHTFHEKAFFSTHNTGVYSATRTLQELCNDKKTVYMPGYELISYTENTDFVELRLRETKTNELRKIRAKHLLLGCGTLQTTRLVLLNHNAYNRQLPFIDHVPSLIPLFIPKYFGAVIPKKTFPVQLIGSMGTQNRRNMISFYYPGGVLWSDFLSDMPFPMDMSFKLLPFILPGMLVAQIWQPVQHIIGNEMSINSEGRIKINYPHVQDMKNRLSHFLKIMRRLGAYSLTRLAQTTIPGWGFHHVGTLPMRLKPCLFETHIDGRLWDSQRVRAIDGSVLPSLPAKNHSLTMMANATRIAKEAQKCNLSSMAHQVL